MKPFLGIDLTADKNNDKFNGDEFIVCRPSSALSDSFENISDEADETIEKSKIHLSLRIIKWICGMIALIVFVGIVESVTDEDAISISNAYNNVPWLFWLCGTCTLSCCILHLIGIKKEKSVLETDETQNLIDNLSRSVDAILVEMSVPLDSKEVDVLSFYYKNKDGKIKPFEKGLQTAQYINPVFNAFSDSDNLYLANLECKYAFPRKSLVAIHTVNKHISIVEWNKDDSYNKGEYKQYKLTEDDYGCIHCKNYYLLELSHNGEEWGIYIPCYELPIFEQLTGLKAQ